MTVVYWLTSIVALMGVLLNIHGRVACFYVWAVTNAVWVYADLTHDLPAQAALQTVYFGLSLYGIWAWRRGGTGTRRGPDGTEGVKSR